MRRRRRPAEAGAAPPPDLLPAVAAWINQERQARLIVSLDREVLWVSAAALSLFAAGCPLTIAGGRLTGVRPALSERLAGFLASLGDEPTCWMVETAEAWIIWGQRIPDDGPPHFGLTVRHRGEAGGFEALAEARDLTPAESRIVTMMLDGLESTAIAQALGISVETLRTHVKHAYRKLGVSSRGELFVGALPFLHP